MPRRVKEPAVRALRITLDLTTKEGTTPYVVIPVSPLCLSPAESKAYKLRKYPGGRPGPVYLCRSTTRGLRCTCQAGYFRKRCKHLDALVAAGMLSEE